MNQTIQKKNAILKEIYRSISRLPKTTRSYKISYYMPAIQNATTIFEIPFNIKINSWTIIADKTGDCILDLWSDTYANLPLTIADTITASAKPTLTADIKATSSNLTGWTTEIHAPTYLQCNVESTTDLAYIYLVLNVTRT